MPRKSQEALISVSGSVSAHAQQELVTEGIENFELPQSLVTNIAKSALPSKAKLSRETVLALLKGSTAFVTTLAGSAHDIAIAKQHKSITSTDVLKALENIGLGDMLDKIQPELQAYRTQAQANPVPSIRIKPPRAPAKNNANANDDDDDANAVRQWDAHMKMHKKGKASASASAVDLSEDKRDD